MYGLSIHVVIVYIPMCARVHIDKPTAEPSRDTWNGLDEIVRAREKTPCVGRWKTSQIIFRESSENDLRAWLEYTFEWKGPPATPTGQILCHSAQTNLQERTRPDLRLTARLDPE